MRQSRYLNVILTVNAVLLGGLLWTNVADQPLFVNEAVAQSRDYAPPNSADLRKKQLDEVRAMRAATDAMYKLIKTGKFKVEVTNLADFPSASSD